MAMSERNAATVTEVEPKGRILERFTGALGVLGSLNHSGQPLAESTEELTLSGTPAVEIGVGLEAALEESAAEHKEIQIYRTS
jgi:hypothetical protein